jgi:type 1 glutamine amidotransferase
LIPQIWVYQNHLEGGQPYRAFVSLLGHHFSTFSSPHVRGTTLRGIAWAGKRDPDSLATQEELAALR